MQKSLFTKELILQAVKDSFTKLDPRVQLKNPVMFITEVGAVWTSFAVLVGVLKGSFSGFEFQIALWLWFTVLFANFSEAIAEGRGKAQADP